MGQEAECRHPTTFVDDNIDLVTNGTSAEIVKHNYLYDLNGNPTQRNTTGQARFKPNEYRAYDVDGFNRLTKTTYKNTQSDVVLGVEAATLDVVGNREHSTNRAGETTYYDLANGANEYASVGPDPNPANNPRSLMTAGATWRSIRTSGATSTTTGTG